MKSIHINAVAFLNFNGFNAVYEVFAENGMTLLGYTGSIALGFPGATVGWNELLLIGGWFPTVAAAAWVNTPPSSLNLPVNMDLGPPTLSQVPNGAQTINGSGAWTGGGNCFLSTILKTNAPAAVNLPLGAMGLDILIPKGGCIVIHIDGDGIEGQPPANAELQLTLFYE